MADGSAIARLLHGLDVGREERIPLALSRDARGHLGQVPLGRGQDILARLRGLREPSPSDVAQHEEEPRPVVQPVEQRVPAA